MKRIHFLILAVSVFLLTFFVTTPAYAQKTIHVREPTLEPDGHTCDTTEWHFIIEGVDKSQSPIPNEITIYWSDSTTEIVSLGEPVTATVLHFRTTSHLTDGVYPVDATAVIYDAYDGNFNLSHGPCDYVQFATYSIETLCWEPGAKNATFTVFHVTLTIEGPTESFEIGKLNNAQFAVDETVIMELEPGDYTYTAEADEGYELQGDPEGQFTIERCPVNGGNGDEGFGGENFMQNAILAGFISAAVLFTILLLFSLRRKPS
jgi:hypothetical protein